MSSFFGKHKRKSVLGLLLLLLRRGGGLPLLLLVLVGGAALVGSNMPGGPIWLRRMIERLPMGHYLIASNSLDFVKMLSALSRARLAPAGFSINTLLHTYSKAYAPNENSTDMVTGGKDLMRKMSGKDGGAAGGGDSIGGVMTPQEASRRRNGVPLSEDELKAGLAKAMAEAGQAGPNGDIDLKKYAKLVADGSIGDGTIGFVRGSNGSGGSGLLGWNNGSRGGASAANPMDTLVSGKFGSGTGSGGAFGDSHCKAAGVKGKLSAFKCVKQTGTASGGGAGALLDRPDSATYKLFETDLFACLANPSSDICCQRPVSGIAYMAQPSCGVVPGMPMRLETSAGTMDIPYTNSQAGGLGLLTASDMGEVPIETANSVPDLQQAANQESDLNACDSAVSGQPAATRVAQYRSDCQQYAANCGGGGKPCSFDNFACCLPFGAAPANCKSTCDGLKNRASQFFADNNDPGMVVLNKCGNVGLSGQVSTSGGFCPN